MLSQEEVSNHASRKSCWVIIQGKAYDLTDFLDEHPGGSAVILRYAGKDATEAYEPIHPSDTLIKYLKAHQHLGVVEPTSGAASKPKAAEARAVAVKKIRLSSFVNLKDFEVGASQVLSRKAYGFYKAAADSEYTAQWNRDSWHAIRFRPRVLVPMETVDTSREIFGNRFSVPFFIAPAGGGKLANPQGEVLMTRAAAKNGALHWVCCMAGCSQKEMAEARAPGQNQYWQIYAMNDLESTAADVRQAVKLGYKGFALTVDAVRAGKRERDLRMGVEEAEAATADSDEELSDDVAHGGVSAIRAPVHPNFDWVSAIAWVRKLTDLPIAIKGIQCWEDALLCMQHGANPWLSNHGGRQLEGAPSAAETLVAIRENCPEVFDRCEVIVDGGILRGTDIVKAIALGAKAVGIGRGFLYALTFGEQGVSKAIRILKQEVETAMALVGVGTLDELRPEHVDTRALVFASAFARAHL